MRQSQQQKTCHDMMVARSRNACWLACTLALALAGCGLFGSKVSSDSGEYKAEATRQGRWKCLPTCRRCREMSASRFPIRAHRPMRCGLPSGGSSSLQSVAVRGTRRA